MSEKLCIEWNEYQRSVCKGLGALQQRGEFVDMTLAADGYHVKVHQLVISLVSPFIKELITSANCPHPIIFLNRVSYITLQAILEYAYTGEVVLSKDKMGEFLEAAKDLQIRGLENMLKSSHTVVEDSIIESNSRKRRKPSHDEEIEDIPVFTDYDDFGQTEVLDKENFDEPQAVVRDEIKLPIDSESCNITHNSKNHTQPAPLQYSVSIHGNLQIVLNRFLYSFIHNRKNSQRYWRCVNQQKTGCLAYVTTIDDKILERGHPHNHAFHDAQILKKIKNGNMFTNVKEVEHAAATTKRKRGDSDILRKALNMSDAY